MDVTLPERFADFLVAAGWGDATIEALPGDASFRRYFRMRRSTGHTAMLMDAPPPQEDTRPFLRAAEWLAAHGLRAPEILHADQEAGLILLEDFGTVRMRDYLDDNPGDEQAIYAGALTALKDLAALPAGPFAEYGMAEYQREARLFTEWYAPTRGLAVDEAGWADAWDAVLTPMMARQQPGVSVLRDYHAENIMLLGSLTEQGVLDFQDALNGHPAYDLVSLLQDARRDVAPELEAAMLDLYLGDRGDREEFLADYARLGAQRNAKIVGIFVRLWKRDGKDRYLAMIPRVWAHLERDLRHPALAPVAHWFDANVPPELRAANGGEWSL